MTDAFCSVPKDFDELADWLLLIQSHFSPSELHGAFCGGLAGAMRLSADEWAQFGLAVVGVTERVSESQFENSKTVLAGLAEQCLELFAANDLSFEPFLPDDENDLVQRTEELSRWCKGFLGGFAEAQAQRQQQGNEELPDTVMESLRDIAAIAQAAIDVDEQEADDEAFDEEAFDDDLNQDLLSLEPVEGHTSTMRETGEEDEKDYSEVVEYLRLAALTVFTEYGWIEVYEKNERSKSKPTLH